ncbi:NitT/TauT family transport system substrate-binding protein [Prauserella shujinwangii]|uniref:NitT/TauT family transport system substrate-binding protein n=1 Tax=Prauserella shujinwangii TaxID=1453103 RepID=A0A2T0M149_9PSEU|nr:ABC transporter substrate-binding protein [Prauserella shujinwangii]PRX50270.1 NitT/TauT family transport system substrate-binding protein [Prauserella shujinwangii]
MLRHGITRVGRPRRRARLASVIATFAVLASVSGCGLLGGGDSESEGGDGPLEKSNITVATLPAIDVAPLHLAVKNGYFKEEGLEVKIDQAASGQAALSKLIGGDAEIAFSSYVPFFVAQSQGVADIRFVADAVSTAPNSVVLVTMPDSGVKDVKDLAGKQIGVSALNTISDALVKSVMKTNDVDHKSVKWTPISFPDIAPALARGDIDAGLLIEPFLTNSAKEQGTVPLVDVATGPTKDFPLAGYGSLAKFAQENPKTIAAFQRAMQRATEEAQDRSVIEPLLIDYAHIEQSTAKLVTLPQFHTTLEATRLQRVVDLMVEFGIIPKKIDAGGMIAKSEAA